MAKKNDDKILIGIVCERSVDLTDKLDENGRLKDCPEAKVIKVPCSGQIQPIMIETALKNGAAGTFTCGCRMGDCHFRDGNKFLRERLLGKRMPKLKPAVDKTKVQAYWLSALEYQQFKKLVQEFKDALDAGGSASTCAAPAGVES